MPHCVFSLPLLPSGKDSEVACKQGKCQTQWQHGSASVLASGQRCRQVISTPVKRHLDRSGILATDCIKKLPLYICPWMQIALAMGVRDWGTVFWLSTNLFHCLPLVTDRYFMRTFNFISCCQFRGFSCFFFLEYRLDSFFSFGQTAEFSRLFLCFSSGHCELSIKCHFSASEQSMTLVVFLRQQSFIQSFKV